MSITSESLKMIVDGEKSPSHQAYEIHPSVAVLEQQQETTKIHTQQLHENNVMIQQVYGIIKTQQDDMRILHGLVVKDKQSFDKQNLDFVKQNSELTQIFGEIEGFITSNKSEMTIVTNDLKKYSKLVQSMKNDIHNNSRRN